MPVLARIVQYYRAGRYQDVIETYRENRMLQNSIVPDVLYYYAMALYREGRTEEANEALMTGDRLYERYLEFQSVERRPWEHLAFSELARDEAKAMIE